MANSAFEQKQTGNASTTAAGSVEIATPAQVAAKTAVGETGAPLAVGPADLPEFGIMTLVANEDIVDRQAVGVGSIWGGVSAANIVSKDISYSSLTHDMASYSARDGTRCVVDSNKLIAINASAATLYAEAFEFDVDTHTAVKGSAVNVVTDYVPVDSNTFQLVQICPLDTNKFIVVYTRTTSTTNIQYKVGTLSGTTITFGAEGTLVTAATTTATGMMSLTQVGTNKGFLVFKCATTTSSRYVAFTVSGDVATAGTPVSPGANMQVNYPTVVGTIATDKVLVMTNDGSSTAYLQVCTLSGTTITDGSQQSITVTGVSSSAGAGYRNTSICKMADDVFIAKIYSTTNSNSSALFAGTVSGTVMTFGSVTYLPISSGYGNMARISATEFVVVGDYSTNYTRLYPGSLSGTTITISTYTLGQVQGPSKLTIYDMGGYFAGIDSGAPTVTKYWFEGMTGNVLGFALNAASRGDNVLVQFAGVVSGITGIVQGHYYFIEDADGLLTILPFSATVNPEKTQKFLAISDSELLIV